MLFRTKVFTAKRARSVGVRQLPAVVRWRPGRRTGILAASLISIAACASPPAEVPEARDFTLAAPATKVDIGTQCQGNDRETLSQCLIAAYVPLLSSVFTPVVTSRGLDFVEPTVVLHDEGAETACGELTAPAYCPGDSTIVIPLAKVTALGDRAPDETLAGILYDEEVLAYFARGLTATELTTGGAYAAVIATVHEYAHHVQNLLGAIDVYQADADRTAVQISRQIELEADCMTGWVAGQLAATGVHQPTLLDDWAGITALTEIGDDFLDASLVDGGHGTVEQRAVAWLEGHVEGAMGSEPFGACQKIVGWATQEPPASQQHTNGENR